VIGIIKEYLASDACKNGFILDGFPRSIPQAEALDAMGVKIDVVLSIEVADEKIVERMSGRRVCSCGASYHVAYNPPKTQDVCDKCGAALYVRADDAAETVKNRLVTFHEQTEPLKDFYAKKGILVTVEGQEEVADTTALVFKALQPFEA
jgi:adenylate kinase